MSGRKLHHRFFATILALGILALIASTISLVVNSAVRTPAASATATLPHGSKTLDVTGFLASFISHKGHLTSAVQAALERPYITFIAESLAPSQNQLSGTLEVILPPGLPPLMTDNGKSVFYNCSASCIIYPRYANDDITVKIAVNGTGVNYEHFYLIPLKDFSAGSTLGLHDYSVTLPLKGYAGWYPQDSYTGDITVALSLPSNAWGPNLDTGPHAQVHAVAGGTVANDYNVRVAPTPSSFQSIESNARDTFSVTISRDWYNQFFVYTVACIPVLFALLFFHLLFFAGGGHGIGRSFEHFTEALVVSVLSVLPLRVVLVPGDISGLTRVDLVLGVGLVLIVAVAAGKYAREIWTGTQSPPSEDEGFKVSRHAFPLEDEQSDPEIAPEPPAPEPPPAAAQGS